MYKRLPPELRYAIELALLFSAYTLTALWGLNLVAIGTFAALLWPPTGIALVALFLGGYRLWPAIALGALVANSMVGALPEAAIAIAVGNTLEALLGVYLLKRYAHLEPPYLSIRDGVGMVAVAFTVPVVSATIGVASLVVTGATPLAQVGEVWSAWWFGDVLGALIILPLALHWLSRDTLKERGTWWFELGVILAFTALMGYGIFWLSLFPFVYPFLIPLAWAAMRVGMRGLMLTLLLITVWGVVGTLAGRGPFVTEDVAANLLLFQASIAMAASVFPLFSAVVEDRRAVNRALSKHVQDLQGALAEVQSANEAKSEFVAILAHELRNPLAPIVSTLELMKLAPMQGPELTSAVGMMSDRATIMTRLLDDLVDVSKITRKNFSLKREPVDLREVVEKALENAATFIESRGHALSVTLPETPVGLHGDRVRLEQIIGNLINNAVKYTESSGSIELSMECAGNLVTVSVRDNGIGMTPEILGRLFEPFYQGSHARGRGEGVGIGLSLAKRLVELHDGTLEAKSDGLGRGSEFTVTFPLSDILPPPPPPAAGRIFSGRKILVVDDNIPAAESLGKLLETTGHTIALATTGEEALERANVFGPDLVILDIGLPGIDGYETARRLRANGYEGVLVALTGYGQDEDRRRAREAGFDRHFTKPVGLSEIEDLFASIEERR